MKWGVAGLLTIVIGLAVVASSGAGQPGGPLAVGARRSCGTFVLRHARYRVSVTKGAVRCATATKVLKGMLTGKGKLHGPPNGPAYKQSYTLDGWRCGFGAGGASCTRAGAGILVLWVKNV